MKYPFRMALVFIWLAVIMMPILVEFEHHDEGPNSHAATCHGDCGCVCHAHAYALTESHAILFEAPVSFSIDSYLPARSEADPAAVDHPPELNS